MTTKYTYTDWTPKSWDDIEKTFSDNFLGQYKKMYELVKHIRQTAVSERLYGLTSMDKLVVTIYDKIDVFKEALHITFNIDTNQWHFEYYSKPFQDPEFVRTYDADIGIKKFDDFLLKVNW